MQEQISPETANVIERIKKLLALALNNDNEHQAAAASAKAMAMMEAHNLDMAVLGKSGKGHQGAARKDQKQKGGLYGWQRELWKACAELNMCVYWSLKGLNKGDVYEHRILGSEVNVLSAQLLAEYLQGTTERLAQQWAKDQGYKSCFVREAIAYREGIAKRLASRLQDARRERIEEDARRVREAAATQKHPSAAPGVGLVLADVIQSEDDLNTDYQYGLEPGTTAARKAEYKARQAYAQSRREIWKTDLARFQELYSADDFKAMQAQDAAEAKHQADWVLYCAGKKSDTYGTPPRPSRSTGVARQRAQTAAEQRQGLASFHQGYHKGGDIGLDQQVGTGKKDLLK